jgi:KipI family sensor histidine kinase inhibitor
MSELVALGDRAVRFARPIGVSARAIVHAVRAWDGVIDCVVARDDVAVYFDRVPPVLDTQLDALATLRDDGADLGRIVELCAIYDGPDLEDIARTIGSMTGDVVRLHVDATYTVELMGFAPGFAYLTGLDAQLACLPRRATPRTKVAAGSLALAGGYTAVYPFDSPGGWNLIGRVHERMFSAEGALLRLGDRVRFVR